MGLPGSLTVQGIHWVYKEKWKRQLNAGTSKILDKLNVEPQLIESGSYSSAVRIHSRLGTKSLIQCTLIWNKEADISKDEHGPQPSAVITTV